MKKTVLIFTMIFWICSSGLFAQQDKPAHLYQLGLTFSSLNSFGLNFKTGNEKTLFRASLFTVNLNADQSKLTTPDTNISKNGSYGAGFRAGFEKQIPVVAHLKLVWGVEAGGNYTYNSSKIDRNGVSNDTESATWKVTPTVNAVLGATYSITDHLLFGAEITPGLSYSFGKTKTTSNTQTLESTNTAYSFGFISNAAKLTLAYCFGK